MNYEAIELDCRELEAPEPMELILKNLHRLDEHNYIKMLHRIEPMMLYPILEQNHYQYRTLIENIVIIYIYKPSLKLQEYIQCL